MKHSKLRYGIVSALIFATTNVWAAEGARQDNSGIFVWAFLGMCALIVVAQIVPALFVLVNATKGIAEAVKERHLVAAEGKGR